ncbi:MAG TPA: hypothetical protein VHS06_11720, partial [Chloroflexota bacterium]|nr:hypothetical protein [Chloroflexota bacterium]
SGTGSPAAEATKGSAPGAKPTEAPKAGSSRTAPVPFGQAITLTQGNRSFEVKVLEVQRDATALVKKANMFNADPKEGMAYVAIKMRLAYLKGPEDKPYSTPSTGESLFAKSRMWGSEVMTVAPEPRLGGNDIFPGATVEGWITPLQAPKDAMDEIVLSWGKDLLGSGEVWFALK